MTEFKGPFVPAIVRRRAATTLAQRDDALRASHYNLGNIPSELVDIDLESDGGTSLMSSAQLGQLVAALGGHTVSGDSFEQLFREVFGYKHIVLCAHGRAAESLWCQATTKPGTVVLGNMLFPTSFFHHFQNMCRVFETIVAEAYDLNSPHPFKGNLDLNRMAKVAALYPGRVQYIWVEPCCNAAGGHPISMRNMREVSQFGRHRRIPVIVNATRILENAYMIQQREDGYRDRSLIDIVREFCSYTEGCSMSAAKDFLVEHGGIVATQDDELHQQIKGLCYIKGAFVSDADRAVLRQGFLEAVHDPSWITQRVELVEYLHKGLKSKGLPVIEPCGGHAVYLDTLRFIPQVPLYQHPSAALCTYLYRASGIRARPGFLTLAQQARGVQLVRLALPARKYSREHMDFVADVIHKAYERRETIRGLCPTNSPTGMAPLQGKEAKFNLASSDTWTAPSWTEIWFERAKLMRNRVLLHAEAPDGRFETFTWGTVADRARWAAQGLIALGFVKGQRAAFLCENCVEWLSMDAACMALGIVSVPIYPPTQASRVQQLVKLSEAVAVFVSGAEQFKKLLDERGRAPEPLQHIVALDIAGCPADDRVISWPALLELGKTNTLYDSAWDAIVRGHSLDSLATIMYTSGTTGIPSGVLMTHGNLVASQFCSGWPFFEDKNYFYPVLLDLNHVLGRNSFYTAVYNGYTTVVMPRKIDTDFDPSIFELYPPSLLVAVPRIVDKLVKYLLEDTRIAESLRTIDDFELEGGPEYGKLLYEDARRKFALRLRAKLGGRIMFIVHAGAPLSAAHQRFFKLAGIMLAEGYGMTECGVISANAVYDIRKDGTVGLTHPYVTVRLGSNDEIQVKGPIVFPGYLNDAQRNAESFVDGGWFRTGDRGKFDEENYVVLTGRIKDTYNLSDGSNIYPSWIEALLTGSEWVEQAVLIGDVRPFVSALILPLWEKLARRLELDGPPSQLAGQSRVTEFFGQIIERLNIHLAPAEQIRAFTLLDSPFPSDCVTEIPSRIKLQIDRANICRTFRTQIESMYERKP